MYLRKSRHHIELSRKENEDKRGLISFFKEIKWQEIVSQIQRKAYKPSSKLAYKYRPLQTLLSFRNLMVRGEGKDQRKHLVLR